MEGIIRPEASILPESSLIPSRNLIIPAPNQFSHEITRSQPYRYAGADPSTSHDGEFPPGTHVLLIRYEGGKYCRVASGEGLYVEIEYDSLTRL